MEQATKVQVLLARLALALIIALIAFGLIWYGFSAEVHQRIWHDLSDRVGGPMTFRFVLQPAMAALAALHDGIKDAQTGRTPYLWTILTGPGDRRDRLREGLTATARILLLGLGIDTVYQLTVLDTFYPGEAAIVAVALAFVPYLLLRGPVARIARRRLARKAAASTPQRKAVS